MYLFDTFTNFLSGLGVQGRDKLTSSQYVTQVWTREQLEAAYRSDWIARKAIQIPAMDSVREWRAWQAEQDQIESLEETEQRLQVQLKLQQALVKARLYGGACILIGVEGDMASELMPETIEKDGLKFIHVFAPHQLTVEELDKDIMSPYYGQPVSYVLQDSDNKFQSVNIHPSRMVRLIGLDTPDPMANMGWGDPLLAVIHDAVNAAGTVSGSVATLIAEAKLDVIKIPGLTEIFSTTVGTNKLLKRFSEANVAKSVINGIVMDAQEEWQRIGVNFAGMPEVLQMYLQIAAGASDIPLTRFAGMSPGGLNSTGDSDLQNYYDRIRSDQELRLTPALEKLDRAIMQSALGAHDDNIFYEWNSLWQMSDSERAEIASKKAQTAKIDVDSGLIPFEALVKGRCNQLIEDGTYPGLEAGIEEAIANAEMPTEAPEPESDPFGMEGQPDNDNVEPDDREVVGDSVGPFGMRLRDGLVALIDRLIPWDPSKHWRDPGGEGGGQFVSMGGPKRAAEFVSPSVKSGLDFAAAVKELDSRQQTRLRVASQDINDRIGLTGVKEVDIIGAWKDGAENSLMSRTDSDWNETVLSAVMKGHLADQKSVLVFQQQERGVSVLAQFDVKGKLNTIHKNLLKDGIENHTVVPTKDGATIYVVDLDGSSLNKIDKAAERYGKDNPVYYQSGRAEFIGDTEYTGTDRQQRDRAREVYESVIAQSSVQNAEAIWQDVRSHWGAPSDKVGYDLTPSAIVAEYPNVKKNSVNKEAVAKLLNKRAGAILKRDLGVDHIDEENHTKETDDYIASVLTLELREGLIAGETGEHWYDDTMKEAMHIAEEIYPGIKTDPNKRFIYTAALAITSQGETVDRNVQLADQAYTHFLEHGSFPTDIKTKKTGIGENLRKMNEAIKARGGGEKGITKMREFFSTEMTARELTEHTNVEPNATLKDDKVYGSAMLGPKIGQGFFQNLNGNFKPITMDLWFMRAWGRITNTGVAGGDMTKQLERLDGAIKAAGMPPASTKAAKIKIAESIESQHEKDYAKHRDEYDSGKREKSELVYASERVMLHHRGNMVEQPENGTKRKWMTDVFNAALKKLKTDYNLDLTPAGAQATWWWPEKSLWEEMGVRGKTRDLDYLKSLRALQQSKKK